MITKKLIKESIDSIKAYGRNNKKHGENVKEIAKSIQANTYITPIIVDEDLIILAGHGRLQALKSLGMKEIEVIQVNGLSEIQKKDFRLRDNKLSELSERDFQNIQIELDELQITELTDLFEGGLEDIDFDNIKSNENRESTKKIQNIICPECDHHFSL